ncbi:MAG: hypothetical protein V1784_04750, partial [bacterium]
MNPEKTQRKILVVEDDLFHIAYVKSCFEKLPSAEIIYAGTYEEAASELFEFGCSDNATGEFGAAIEGLLTTQI